MSRILDRLADCFSEFFRRFSRAQRGGIVELIAAGIVPRNAGIGGAVDAAPGYLVKSRLPQAFGAAAMASVRQMFSPTPDNGIRMFFAAKFRPASRVPR